MSIFHHAKEPQYQNESLGYSCEPPSGVSVGKKLQHAYSHHCHYRYEGPVGGGSYNHGKYSNAYDSILYFVLHCPPRPDAANPLRRLGVVVGTYGRESADTGDSRIEIREGLTGSYTTAWESPIEAVTSLKYQILRIEGSTTITPPGTGVGSPTMANDAFKVFEVKLTNMQPTQCFLMWLPDDTVQPGNVALTSEQMAPGRIIKEPNSLGEMVELIGDGNTFAESIERMTRRTFFNYSCPTQCYIAGTGSKIDIFTTTGGNAAQFPARCRNLDNAGEGKYCYPAAVIYVTGNDRGERLYFDNITQGSSWYYEIQSGDPINTPFLVHPGRTGASSSAGIKVGTTADNYFKLSANVSSGRAMWVYNHALFEGPYWTS